MKQTRRESKRFHAGSDCQKTYPAESFGGKNSVKGNRHTEPQRGVSERNRRKAAALSAEMGSLSRSITRRSDQNCKIILQILILQFCRQLVKKVQKDFFDKLSKAEMPSASPLCVTAGEKRTIAPEAGYRQALPKVP